MKSNIKKRLAAALCVPALCVPLASCARGNDFSVSVMVLDGADHDVTSENPVKVRYGGDASFSLSLAKNDKVVSVTSGGEEIKDFTYENGVLTLHDVTSPQTLTLSIGDPYKKCEFWMYSNTSRGGGFYSTASQGRVARGTVITVTASPNDGAVFLGWSAGKSLEKGGKLLSKDEQYTLTVKNDTTLYANYDASNVPKIEKKKPVLVDVPKREENKRPEAPQVVREKVVELIYNANGGQLSDGTAELKTDFCLDYHTMANSLPENGTFTRDGYVLVGYNTEPDGSGEYIGMGHKFIIPDENAPTMLYCMWQKAEDEASFEYSINNEYAVLEKYTGTSSEVYIPKTLGGKTVTQIADGAFSSSAASYVYIPSGVVSVSDSAFTDSRGLEKITFFDSLVKVSDASFAGTSLKTLDLHAAGNPRYSDSDLSFAKKYERFAANADRDRIIIVSGSSKHFGFDSDYAEELLGGEYAVINYGTNAQMNVVFFLEALSNLADSDDRIIFAPEQYGPYCDTVNGNPAMTALTFQGCESCYNLVSSVDISKYTGVFAAFSQYSAQRRGMREKSYESYSRVIDEYGDCSVPRKNYNGENYRNGANGTFYFKAGTVPAEFAANVNRILSVASSNGIKTYLSYPSYNINACDPTTLNDAGYDAYNADMSNIFSAQLISDVRNYIHEGKYFYNTDYHLMEEGAKIHTERTCNDIRTILN